MKVPIRASFVLFCLQATATSGSLRSRAKSALHKGDGLQAALGRMNHNLDQEDDQDELPDTPTRDNPAGQMHTHMLGDNDFDLRFLGNGHVHILSTEPSHPVTDHSPSQCQNYHSLSLSPHFGRSLACVHVVLQTQP